LQSHERRALRVHLKKGATLTQLAKEFASALQTKEEKPKAKRKSK